MAPAQPFCWANVSRSRLLLAKQDQQRYPRNCLRTASSVIVALVGPGMSLILYFHPFASFCQKVLIGLYEYDIPFEPLLIDLGDQESRAKLEAVWPLTKFPVLDDRERNVVVPESSLIIDYLGRHHAGSVRLIPDDPEVAMRAHLLDRTFDQYVALQLTKVVIDSLRPEDGRDPIGVEQAKATIIKAFEIVESYLGEEGWAVGSAFSLADCAAAPSLFYANTVVPIADYPKLAAYYQRLLARPSFARVVEEARPYRHLFPLAWPIDYA
jgi:glutathione S-transferase